MAGLLFQLKFLGHPPSMRTENGTDVYPLSDFLFYMILGRKVDSAKLLFRKNVE